MFTSWYEKFSSQPHQPFFAFGIILLIAFTTILFAQFSGSINLEISILQFHIYPFIFMIFIQFFLGFLFVVFPRFLMQPVIKPNVYMNLFFLYFFSSILYTFGLFLFKPLVIVSTMLFLIAQCMGFYILYAIFSKSIVADKYDTKWVLIAYLVGIVSHILFFISSFYSNVFIEKLATYTGFYLFLFVLIFAISQRMIPMFTQVKLPNYVKNKSKYIMETVFFLLALKCAILLMDDVRLNLISDLPLLLFFVYEIIYKWRLPFFKVSPIVWVLYLAIYYIVMGFALSCIESISHIFLSNPLFFEKSVVHIFAIGYFITVLVGFGTRVTLGHSGRVPTADNIAIFMFMAIQVVVLFRTFASFSVNFGFEYGFWINVSAMLLIISLCAWSARYLGILLKGHNPAH